MIVAAAVRLGSKHHGHVHIAGQAGEPLRMSRVRKSREMEGVLVGWASDDGVYFPTEGQLDGGFH
jgi:hypothetical protein